MFRLTTTSPEQSFKNVIEPFAANYVYIRDHRYGWGGKHLRMHYLKEGDSNAKDVSIIHIIYPTVILHNRS